MVRRFSPARDSHGHIIAGALPTTARGKFGSAQLFTFTTHQGTDRHGNLWSPRKIKLFATLKRRRRRVRRK